MVLDLVPHKPWTKYVFVPSVLVANLYFLVTAPLDAHGYIFGYGIALGQMLGFAALMSVVSVLITDGPDLDDLTDGGDA